MSELIPIVNLDDEIIGYKARKEISSEDIYRVSALWVENSKWEALLAERGFMKSHSPWKWWPAVAGTVGKWESYEENIYKEAREELWITWYSFKELVKLYKNWPKYFYFCQWYECVIDRGISEFIIEYPQVERARWFTRAELQNIVDNNPELLTGLEFIKAWLKK